MYDDKVFIKTLNYNTNKRLVYCVYAIGKQV